MSPTFSSVFSSASSPYSTQISHSTIDNRTTILTVVLVSVGILLFAGAIFLTIWLRKRRFSHDSRSSDPFSSTTNLTLKLSASHGTQITDPFHLAARITPFGSPGGETPRFSTSLLHTLSFFNLNNLGQQNAPPAPRCASPIAYPLVHGTLLTLVTLLRLQELRTSTYCPRNRRRPPYQQWLPRIRDRARGKSVKPTL